MARAGVGRYLGFKAECHVIELITAGVTDHWCQYHGYYLITCQTCGRAFHAVRPHTLYCSTSCSQYAYRQRIKARG